MQINTTMFILELIGTVAFAVSGAIAGMKKRMDILGVAMMAIITATGGGAIRDITLGLAPPLVFRKPLYLIIALVTCLLLMIVVKLTGESGDLTTKLPRKTMEYAINLSDAIGLGVFTVSGVSLAINEGHGENFILLLFVGTITGVGGGIMRDLFTQRVPSVFIRHIYALAAMCGVVVFFILRSNIHRSLAMIVAVAVVIVIRFISYRYKLSLPIIYLQSSE